MPTIDEFAARFTEEPGYLNFPSFGPLGEAALEEQRAQSELMTRARFGSVPSMEAEEERVDAAVAALLSRTPRWQSL